MTKWNDAFKQDVVAELNTLADELHLDAAEAGEDDVLATAIVAGLSGQDTLEPVLLRILGHEEGIRVEMRNVCFAGSHGAIVNRAMRYIMGRLFTPRKQEDMPGRDQIALCGLFADQFRNGNRTTDDLVAMIAVASNAVTLRTSAAIDIRNGEVLVDTFVPCDEGELPEDFEGPLRWVLHHSSMIQQTARFVRDLLSPDHVPAPQTIEKLSEKLLSLDEIQDGQANEREVIDEVTL